MRSVPFPEHGDTIKINDGARSYDLSVYLKSPGAPAGHYRVELYDADQPNPSYLVPATSDADGQIYHNVLIQPGLGNWWEGEMA